MSGRLYVPVVQATLIFGSENLVVTTPHGVDPGGVPPSGGADNYREAQKLTTGWGLGVTCNIGGANGGGYKGVGGINSMEREHGRKVHFHLAHHGHLPGSREVTGEQGRKTVVGAGQPAVCESTGGWEWGDI